jgi:carboxyl-terminal processing protease
MAMRVPLGVAGLSLVPAYGSGVLAAEAPVAPSDLAAAAPLQATSSLRQAYDLLLDNFVSPPAPAQLLVVTAAEFGKRVAEIHPVAWSVPMIPADLSRDEAWAAFDAWHERQADMLAPAIDRTAISELTMRALAAAVSEQHTRYLDARQNQEHQAWRRGEVRYDGIGARLRRPSTVVLEVFEDSPAARAGLKAGDRIIAVNGESVENGTSEQAISKIRGPLGSPVDIVVERRGEAAALRLTVHRAEIALPFVRWDMLPRADGSKIGYLQIRGFPEPSVDERVALALADLDHRGVEGLILDLRGNSGGRIDVGMKVASRFLREGVVFQQIDRAGRERQVRPTTGTYWERAVPTVALVDGGTASMGEILGAALQETGVARVVGTKTAGSVAGARLFSLGNGGAMQITVLTITSGRGVPLNEVGLQPDILIDLSDDDLLQGIDGQLEAAIRALNIPSRRLGLHLVAPEGRATVTDEEVAA